MGLYHDLDALCFAPELERKNKAPKCKVTLNKDHFLFKKIVFASMFSGSNNIDLITGKELYFRGNYCQKGFSSHGVGFETLDSIDNSAYGKGSTAVYAITNKVTMIWAGRIDAWLNFMGLISIPYSSTSWVSPFASLGFHATNIAGQAKVHYSVGGANNSVIGPSSYLLYDGTTHVYSVSMSIVSGSASAEFYRDGVLIGSATPATTGSIAFNTNNDVVVNCADRYGNDTAAVDGVCNTAIILNDVINSDAHKKLANDLYSVYIPEMFGFWMPEVLGSGTTYNQSVSGAITPSGSVSTAITFVMAVAGTITMTGTIAKKIQKALAGSLTGSGLIFKKTMKTLSGTSTGTGNVNKKTATTRSGSITASGALSTLIVVTQSIAGSLTPSGVVSGVKTLASTFSNIARNLVKSVKRTMGFDVTDIDRDT